jgi:hypothetical protein
MGGRGRPHLPPPVATGDDAVSLVALAEAWIEPYGNAHHLVRTRDWLLELEPEAGEAVVLAALTHDMERHFPGGPVMDPATTPPADPTYRRLHSERSARIVGDWLREQGANGGLIEEVERLVLAHEVGGTADENLVQAADSLSFLEVNADLVAGWFKEGRCSRERAKAQLAYMYERIQVGRALELGGPLYEEGIAVVERA